MDTTALVRPLSGPGLIARAGDILLVCAEAAEADQLLGLVTDVAASNGDGGMLVRRVAALIAADLDGRFPDCAVCAPASDGRLALLVHGGATADVAGAAGELSITGADSITSVTRMIAGGITSIRLILPGAGAANPRARLDSGVVVAAGLIFSAADVASEAAIPAPRPEGSFPAEVPPVTEPGAEPSAKPDTEPGDEPGAGPGDTAGAEAGQVEQRVGSAPAPVQTLGEAPPAAAEPPPFTMDPPPGPFTMDPPPSAPFVSMVVAPGTDGPAALAPPVEVDPDARPVVLGVLCPNDHFTDPAATTCPTCGVTLAGRTLITREGPRPALGVLLLDDGSAFSLDADYVIGREPQNDPDVIAGAARPLRVIDVEGVVSRRHARVALVGWDVQVIDLGSANGTFLDPPGADRHQLAANQPVRIHPGTQVTLGRRWLRYEAVQAGTGAGGPNGAGG